LEVIYKFSTTNFVPSDIQLVNFYRAL